MKKLIFIPLFLGVLVYGGGDITPITDYELEDEYIADDLGDYQDDEYIDEVTEEDEYIEEEEEEEIVAPTPTPTPSPTPIYIPPTPTKIPPKPKPKTIRTNGLYIGLGITRNRYSDSCYCDTKKGKIEVKNRDTTYGLMGRVGYDFNQYVGIEVRGSKTNWKSDGTRVNHIGAFIKPMVPITGNTNIYGLIGVAKTKTEGSMPHIDTTALALGGGVEFDLSEDIPKNGRYNRDFDGHGDQEKGIGLFLDYEKMVVKKDAPSLDAVSAGLSYDF